MNFCSLGRNWPQVQLESIKIDSKTVRTKFECARSINYPYMGPGKNFPKSRIHRALRKIEHGHNSRIYPHGALKFCRYRLGVEIYRSQTNLSRVIPQEEKFIFRSFRSFQELWCTWKL